MPTVTVSPKFQIVIPLEIREAMKLSPGQRLEVILYENRIELIPVSPMPRVRGFLQGMDTNVVREPDREL
jgi:AbrB family looped-hinge helix DNA binding protein